MRFDYKVAGETVSLESDDQAVAVRFDPASTRSQRAEVASAAQVHYADRVGVVGEQFSIMPAPPRGRTQLARSASARAAFTESPLVQHMAPVFRVPGGRAVAAQRVLLALKEPAAAAAADAHAWLLDGKPERTVVGNELVEGGLTLHLGPSEDPLQVAAALAEDPRVRFAEPAFVNLLSRLRGRGGTRVRRVDPMLGDQYAMRLTRAIEAWGLQEGSSDVVVAILDEGVDTRHEDLPAGLQYDAIDGDTYQEPNAWDGHGTACAGLAVARGGNGRGVVGVGNGCGLMAVRIAQTRGPAQEWQSSSEQIAAGIQWAWRHGAAVLSNSWGGGAPSNVVKEAIEAARRHGRGGKGCVVVAAAGNDGQPVSFPASLPEVLAVAACNEQDEPKTWDSADGEHGWSSNFGPEVDVAAPGVRNLTTDITGVAGYNNGPALDINYYDLFNGTSSSTPLVAGAAALVLSANPALTEREVRELLCETAAKVGSVRYVLAHGERHSRNDRMGCGRLDVAAAVQRAIALRDK